MKFLPLFFLALFGFLACKSETKMTDDEKIKSNIRHYFFLSDSIPVKYEIKDTLYSNELEEMLNTIENNILLVRMDLDSLSLMIARKAAQKQDFELQIGTWAQRGNEMYQDSANLAALQLKDMQLKQYRLQNTEKEFRQTNRVLLHLKRSVWANIAGFDIHFEYQTDQLDVELDMMMDANFELVD